VAAGANTIKLLVLPFSEFAMIGISAFFVNNASDILYFNSIYFSKNI
jgi:hypothetical protein